MESDKQRVLILVAQIPKGKIVSYGMIADRLNLTPRVVGFIMNGFTEKEAQEYPWHRVVNRQGFISSSKLGVKGDVQQAMLIAEGIEVKEYQIVEPKKHWYAFK
jgi:methylated-DNA-protein-cysteine methyltransferase related protein